MIIDATDRALIREQVAQIKANRNTLIEVYEETRHNKPSYTIAKLVEKLGYNKAVETVAELVNGVSQGDGRVYQKQRDWAKSIPTACDGDTLKEHWIYTPSEIHPAHIQQIAEAMMKYPSPQHSQQILQEILTTTDREHAYELTADFVGNIENPIEFSKLMLSLDEKSQQDIYNIFGEVLGEEAKKTAMNTVSVYRLTHDEEFRQAVMKVLGEQLYKEFNSTNDDDDDVLDLTESEGLSR